MTNLIDIYEAAGGVVSEDRNHVTIDPTNRKPFKIELLVYPEAIESSYDAPDEVTFGVVLHDGFAIENVGIGGGIVHTHRYDTTIKLPVDQVVIVKEET